MKVVLPGQDDNMLWLSASFTPFGGFERVHHIYVSWSIGRRQYSLPPSITALCTFSRVYCMTLYSLEPEVNESASIELGP